MREYTLNDIKYNPDPITLCPLGQKDDVDEEDLKADGKRNRELMERLFREFEERKVSGNRIL